MKRIKKLFYFTSYHSENPLLTARIYNGNVEVLNRLYVNIVNVDILLPRLYVNIVNVDILLPRLYVNIVNVDILRPRLYVNIVMLIYYYHAYM